MPRFLRVLLIVLAVIAALVLGAARYYLGRTPVPEQSDYVLDLAEVRRLASSIPGAAPIAVNHAQVAEASLPEGAVFATRSLRTPAPDDARRLSGRLSGRLHPDRLGLRRRRAARDEPGGGVLDRSVGRDPARARRGQEDRDHARARRPPRRHRPLRRARQAGRPARAEQGAARQRARAQPREVPRLARQVRDSDRVRALLRARARRRADPRARPHARESARVRAARERPGAALHRRRRLAHGPAPRALVPPAARHRPVHPREPRPGAGGVPHAARPGRARARARDRRLARRRRAQGPDRQGRARRPLRSSSGSSASGWSSDTAPRTGSRSTRSSRCSCRRRRRSRCTSR